MDQQLQAQGMGRRALSERELLSIRRAMSALPPDHAPPFNPLQNYHHFGGWDIPLEDRARESLTDQLFGYSPKNRVTAREIVTDIERQLAERGAAVPSDTGERKVRLVLPSSDSRRPSILTPWSERFGRGDERWRS